MDDTNNNSCTEMSLWFCSVFAHQGLICFLISLLCKHMSKCENRFLSSPTDNQGDGKSLGKSLKQASSWGNTRWQWERGIYYGNKYLRDSNFTQNLVPTWSSIQDYTKGIAQT